MHEAVAGGKQEVIVSPANDPLFIIVEMPASKACKLQLFPWETVKGALETITELLPRLGVARERYSIGKCINSI
jgi:hypothetical protein